MLTLLISWMTAPESTLFMVATLIYYTLIFHYDYKYYNSTRKEPLFYYSSRYFLSLLFNSLRLPRSLLYRGQIAMWNKVSVIFTCGPGQYTSTVLLLNSLSPSSHSPHHRQWLHLLAFQPLHTSDHHPNDPLVSSIRSAVHWWQR